MVVYCKNHTAHKNTLCGQNVEFLLSKPVVHITATKPSTIHKYCIERVMLKFMPKIKPKKYFYTICTALVFSDIRRYVSVVDCGKVTQLLYGSVTYTNGTTFYGSTLTYTCVKNYRLVGVTSRRCLENGQWSDESPRCEGKFCDLIHK